MLPMERTAGMRKEPSGIHKQKFDFVEKPDEIEAIRAGPALGMALMESLDIPDLIDSLTVWDRSQRVLSPGKAAKAICGTMFTENIRRALNNIEGFYGYSPVDSLFGEYADHSSLNDVSLGRAMDTLYKADTKLLYYNIASRVKAMCHFVSKYYHFDGTNVTVTRSPGDPLDDFAAVPAFGHPKDGRKDRMQYNIQSIVDDNGLPVYQRLHSGNVTDAKMDLDALITVEDVMADERIVAVADCKFVTKDMVDRLIWDNVPFVSKCPENFGEKVREKVVRKAYEGTFEYVGRIGKRKDAPEYEIFDTSETVNGERLRFVAYREVGQKHSLDYYRNKVSKDVDKIIKSLSNRKFACEKDARKEIARVRKKMKGKPYHLDFATECMMVMPKRSRKGRPMKGEPSPEPVEEWRVRAAKSFDESLAIEMARLRDIRVIVTSLPSSAETCEIVSDGCTAADVLRIYLNQWKVESIFGEMKSKLGADEVFFESPKREESMVFLISLAVLIRRVMQLLLRAQYGKGYGVRKDVTANSVFCSLQNTQVRMDRKKGRLYLDGPQEEERAMRAYLNILDIDPVELIG